MIKYLKIHKLWFFSLIIILVIVSFYIFSNRTKIDESVVVSKPDVQTYGIPDKYMAVFSRLAYVMKVGEWQELYDYQRDYEKQIKKMNQKLLINNEQLDDLYNDWTVTNIFYEPNYSFEAISFYNKRKNIMVISYRGTEMGDRFDYGVDLFQVFMGKNTVAANLAKEAFEETYSDLLDKKKRDVKFVVTGHSLGGALAQEVAKLYYEQRNAYVEIKDFETVTFNSPGIANDHNLEHQEKGIAEHFKYYISSMTLDKKRLDPISAFLYFDLYHVNDENVNIITIDQDKPVQSIGQFITKNNLTKKELFSKKNLFTFLLHQSEMKKVHNISEILRSME